MLAAAAATRPEGVIARGVGLRKGIKNEPTKNDGVRQPTKPPMCGGLVEQ